MVAGHLQQKKGYWYMVLNLHDQAGRRKTKWIATHLPVPGNRKRAEELLFQTRHQYADSKGESGLLFADYMLQWLGIMKAKVSPTTYTGYRNLVEKQHLPLLLGEAYHTGRASRVRCPEILRRSPCVRGIGQYDSPPSRQYPQGTERRGAAGPGGPERSRYCGAAKESTLYPAVLLTGGGK